MAGMDKLMDLVCDEIRDAKRYAKLALEYRDTDKDLADLYYRLSGEELDHANRLHVQVVRLLDTQQRIGTNGVDVNKAIYEHLRKRNVENISEVGVLQALYKGK